MALDLQQKQIINKRYELIKLVGIGGLGRVFKAKDLRTRNIVAIKFLADHFINNHQVLGVFHRELLLTSKLRHKNIINYVDSHFDPPMCYIVNEYVDGWNGHQFIKTVKKLPPLIALAICVDLLQGIDYLHLHDMVHSDMSISNFMLSRNGRAYITDFGFSVDPNIESYANQLFGTPGFYSPEHITRAKITPSSDLYCVGLILFILLTGKNPLPMQKDPRKVIPKMKYLSFHDVQISNKQIQNSILKVLKKSLSYRKFFRYDSAKQMSYDCFQIIAGRGLSYPRAGILQYLIDCNMSSQQFALPKQNIYLQ